MGHRGLELNIRAFITRMRCWGMLYYSLSKEAPQDKIANYEGPFFSGILGLGFIALLRFGVWGLGFWSSGLRVCMGFRAPGSAFFFFGGGGLGLIV